MPVADAGSENVEITRECGDPACPLNWATPDSPGYRHSLLLDSVH
jgi:hypothetical protein